MSDLTESARRHLTWLHTFQEQWASAGVAVLQHDYVLLAMGSFTLVVGTAHRRVKFQWDGRAFLLDVAECTCRSQSSPELWRPVQSFNIEPPERVEPVIERLCREFFAG